MTWDRLGRDGSTKLISLEKELLIEMKCNVIKFEECVLLGSLCASESYHCNNLWITIEVVTALEQFRRAQIISQTDFGSRLQKHFSAVVDVNKNASSEPCGANKWEIKIKREESHLLLGYDNCVLLSIFGFWNTKRKTLGCDVRCLYLIWWNTRLWRRIGLS